MAPSLTMMPYGAFSNLGNEIMFEVLILHLGFLKAGEVLHPGEHKSAD